MGVATNQWKPMGCDDGEEKGVGPSTELYIHIQLMERDWKGWVAPLMESTMGSKVGGRCGFVQSHLKKRLFILCLPKQMCQQHRRNNMELNRHWECERGENRRGELEGCGAER